MAHTVESFVDTLRADGVEAGRKAAREIRRQAEQEAAQLVAEAEAKAGKIIEDAEQQRQMTLERTRADLELAARDTLGRLREALSQAVNRLLTHEASNALNDKDFLKELIREIAGTYAQSDAAGKQTIELNVPQPMRRKLADWAIATLHDRREQKLSVELHGSLKTAGFEYKVSGGTVEVTPESVVQVLSEIVTPELQRLITSSQESQSDGG